MKQYAQNIAKVLYLIMFFFLINISYSNEMLYECYIMNTVQGKEIIEYFINQLKEEGIIYVAPWKDPNEMSEKNEG